MYLNDTFLHNEPKLNVCTCLELFCSSVNRGHGDVTETEADMYMFQHTTLSLARLYYMSNIPQLEIE